MFCGDKDVSIPWDVRYLRNLPNKLMKDSAIGTHNTTLLHTKCLLLVEERNVFCWWRREKKRNASAYKDSIQGLINSQLHQLTKCPQVSEC